jgi:hypothetical protein
MLKGEFKSKTRSSGFCFFISFTPAVRCIPVSSKKTRREMPLPSGLVYSFSFSKRFSKHCARNKERAKKAQLSESGNQLETLPTQKICLTIYKNKSVYLVLRKVCILSHLYTRFWVDMCDGVTHIY